MKCFITLEFSAGKFKTIISKKYILEIPANNLHYYKDKK